MHILRLTTHLMLFAVAVSAYAATGDTVVAGAGAVGPDTGTTVSRVAPVVDSRRGISTASVQADTGALDSAARRIMADSLNKIQRGVTAGFSLFPRPVDSVFGLKHVTQRQLYASDATDAAELFRYSPYYVHVPVNSAGALNRSLLRGVPYAGANEHDPADAGIDYRDVMGILSPGEVAGIDVAAAEGAMLRMHPQPLISPLMLLCWENGVFSESSLQVLFARPIARTVVAAVYTNYRYFAAQDFSHDAGAINSTFEGMGMDTSLIMYKGRNPLTNEMISGLRVQWDGGGPRARLDYRYADLHDEVAVPGGALTQAASTPGLVWSNVAHYIHLADLSVSNVPAGPFSGTVKGFMRSAVQNQLSGSRFLPSSSRGSATWGGGSILGALALHTGDTVSASYRIRTETRTPYDLREWHMLSQRALLAYGRQMQFNGWNAGLDVAAGHLFNSVNDSFGNAWIYRANIAASSQRFCAALFGRRDAYEYAPPLDTGLFQRGNVLDPVSCYGGDVRVNLGYAGALVGYSYTTEADSATVSRYWPGGIAPYRQPRSVVTIAPEAGRLKGFALYSRWMISDAMPHLKVQSALSYHASAAGGNQNLDLDLGLDYWSERDGEKYAGSQMWNREIWNLNVKVAVQIKEFRLFYKMDNLLNREISYVPGYMLPGLVFRWGFNWLLQR